MGRTGAAQRSKKAEKAKVKLKSHPTKFLPKGRNVTDTTFKVRKIVIQEQLRTQDGSQPLTKRKLNIKEVLARLQHYNASQRQEGLVGLSELLTQMDQSQLTTHISQIADALGRLALDGESSVRRHSAHILASLFASCGETQLLPFCPILGSYLSCAMTHIQLGIQEDSLFLLDALLKNTPRLIAGSANQLLPCVLDMISRTRGDSHSSRQLSVNLSSDLTSLTWRARVFGRLQALLLVSLQHRNGMIKETLANKAYHQSIPITIEPEGNFYFPLYNKFYSTPVSLSNIFHKSQKSTRELLDDAAELRIFSEALMPLMLDCWVEVNPLTSRKSESKSEDSGLPFESALILYSILEIINLLWQHLTLREKENKVNDLAEWFKKKYVKDINRFLVRGFPYSARAGHSIEGESEFGSQGYGRRKTNSSSKNNSESVLLKMALPFFLQDQDEQSGTRAVAKCVPQNLTMCHLLANLTESPPTTVKEGITEFLISCLNQWGGSLAPWSNHLLLALRSVFERSQAWSFNLNPLLSAVVSRYRRSSLKQSPSHKILASELCLLLGEISLTASYGHLEQCETFSSWIYQLPTMLSSGDVSLDSLCMLNKLASQNNAKFLQGLQNAFTSLLNALRDFQVDGKENVSEKETGLASLFYWIPVWTDEQVSQLEDAVHNNQCSSSLVKKVMTVLSLKRDRFSALANAHCLVEVH